MEYNYEFWYDVAEFISEINRGNATPREIALDAYEYLCEWQRSMEVEMVTETIEIIINLLTEDGSERATELLDEINYNIDKYELAQEVQP